MFCRKNVVCLLLVFTAAILSISCATTFNRRNPYPGMEILNYNNSNIYFFPNPNSDRLLIIMEGSGWSSVLGIRQGRRWREVQTGSQFLQELRDYYNIIILERLARQPGMCHRADMEDRANYTAGNLIYSYSESINNFLEHRSFSSIVLIGTSQGAMLLPMVYERMENRNSVTAMVSFAFGGLSMYESYRILMTRQNIPPGYFEMYFNLAFIFSPERVILDEAFRSSYKEDFFGYTFLWYNSFMHIRPFDYWKNITTPVLFVHGINDLNVAVESTEYIQRNLPEKPFEFKYFPWAHFPTRAREVIQFRRAISDWILATDSR